MKSHLHSKNGHSIVRAIWKVSSHCIYVSIVSMAGYFPDSTGIYKLFYHRKIVNNPDIQQYKCIVSYIPKLEYYAITKILIVISRKKINKIGKSSRHIKLKRNKEVSPTPSSSFCQIQQYLPNAGQGEENKAEN